MAQMPVEPDTAVTDTSWTALWGDSIATDTIEPVPMVSIFDSLPYVRVHQDSLIYALLLDKRIGADPQPEVIGYRVQVFSSNRQQAAKTEAVELQQKLKRALPIEVYAQYISPFWKVRVGDFRTYEEAKLFKDILLTKYPYLTADTYIVKDQINVRK